MLAVLYRRYGGPEVLVVESVPEPHPPAGAIRIHTSAVSVNPIDYKFRRGDLKEFVALSFPVVPGRDAAGFVDEIGEGVEGVEIGDPVFGLGGATDSYMEHAVLTAWATWPGVWSAQQAAAAGLASVTALRGLRRLGAIDGTLVIAGDGVAERVRAVAPDGGKSGLDTAGGSSLEDLVHIIGDPERVVTVVDPVQANQLGVRYADGENDPAALREAGQLGASGAYVPRVGHVLPLERAVEAHRLAEQGAHGGKVVLLLAGADTAKTSSTGSVGA